MKNKFDAFLENYRIVVNDEVLKITDWLREEFIKSGTKGAVLGMSGGVDCSVVARLLQLAGIPTLLVMMPYGKSMKYAGDEKDAMDLINKFGFEYVKVDITNTVTTLLDTMSGYSGVKGVVETSYMDEYVCKRGEPITLSDMAISNINPRIRMTTLYAIAQSKGYMVVGTGNLSERMLGYFTKWGDGACDINPLGNITKSQVFIIARALGLPENIVNKKPSANLWEGQTDEQELGMTYYDIDKYILTKEGSANVVSKFTAMTTKIQHKLLPIAMY